MQERDVADVSWVRWCGVVADVAWQPAVVVRIVWPSSVLLHMNGAPSEVRPLRDGIPRRPPFACCAGDVVVVVVVSGWLAVAWCVRLSVVIVVVRG